MSYESCLIYDISDTVKIILVKLQERRSQNKVNIVNSLQADKPNLAEWHSDPHSMSAREELTMQQSYDAIKYRPRHVHTRRRNQQANLLDPMEDHRKIFRKINPFIHLIKLGFLSI